ncbi:MAG: hypothetical protein LBE23_05850 [Vagococcus sp.]|nr:hypothetical protein [Vagococcus sp.]
MGNTQDTTSNYETSYFSDYAKAFNSQKYTGNMYMLSPQLLNSGLKDMNMLSSVFNTDQIKRMVMQPHEYEQELRKLSFYDFNTIGIYKQIINLWSKLLTFDWNPIPYTVDGKPISSSDFHSEAYKSDYAELCKFFNNFKEKDEFSKVLWNLCMYDTYYTSYREYEDHIYLQELPSSHCMIDSDSYLGYLFSLDLSYFMNNGVDINAYSPKIKQLFNQAINNSKMNYRPDMPNRNGKWVNWTTMMPDDAYVFKFNRQFAGSVPPLLSSMIDYSKIDKYKELEDTKKQLEAYKVIFATVPRLTGNKTGNRTDDFAISATALGEFVAAVKETLGASVDFKAAPLEDFKAFDFSPSANEANLLNTELKNIMLQAGTTDALSMTGTVNMASADIYKTFTSSVIEDLYGQFSNFCEYHINKNCKKFKWRIEFLGTKFDRKDRIKQADNDLQYGIITPNIYSSRGIKFTDAQNITNMMYTMGYPEFMKPVKTASTMSSKDKENSSGRDLKDESDLSDSGAQTRNADSNTNTKGTEAKV